MHPIIPSIFRALLFVAAYVLLDWVSYFHPMYGLNITPWNPSLALGLVYWFQIGRIAAIPWFIAILIGEILVRNLPASLPATILFSLVLTLGYCLLAASLRHFVAGDVLHDRRSLLFWLVIVIVGTFITSGGYITVLFLSDMIPVGDWAVALVRFWVGDFVGIVVTMPFFGLLLKECDQLLNLLTRWETVCYGVLGIAMLWVAFGLGGHGEFQYFYLLFLPIIWAAARQGVQGAAIAAFALQAGIIIAVRWQNVVEVTVFELQMLGAVLAFVGFFIGVVVDEKQRVSDELRETLRLAAAGEMAGALAHELSQPLTALSAYGSACEQLLAQGETGDRLRETIRRMVSEAFRAADVVRRLRDFFRTGATQLERTRLDSLLAAAIGPFEAKAKQTGIELTMDTPPACGLLVDRLQMEVVLRNLLSNAFDAVSEQPNGENRIRIIAQAEGTERVCIQVEDSGAGLTDLAAAHIFEAFQSSKSTGLGLGLVISRAIVEAHGGTLKAEAKPYGLFKLVLPIEGKINDYS
ncbi:MAG: ATP-binding protein [Zoogloea sp.]|uniref:ATP-binding protein n=1 Tax=Zoogloea sp. TaxID=49181 RepID=UPI003F351A25